jgi:PmbA protein
MLALQTHGGQAMPEVIERQYSARKVAQRQEDLLSLCREALKASGADQTQARISVVDSALTRFASSEIHQNTFERNASVQVTARIALPGGLAEGSAATNRLDKESIAVAARQACEAARHAPPSAELADYAKGPFEYPCQVDFYEATAACTPEERAKKVIAGFKVKTGPEPFTAAGTLSTSAINFAVANSRGVEAAYNTTMARYTVQWNGPDSSGYREGSSRNIGAIDVEELSVKALDTGIRSAAPRADVPAGRYAVVLAPECVATLLAFLSGLGLSGKSYLDGASFMHGRLGEPITGAGFTLMDDALHPLTIGAPCDQAGVPLTRVMLIENGVARGVVHDVNSAARAGLTGSTGHDSGGKRPLPQNLVLMPGSSSREELIKSVERGIYVSRFHYSNVVDPLNTVITGMTRDGTFLIEGGEITGGLTNFRYTQNILEAFKQVSGAAREQVYQGSMWGSGCVVPEALRVEDFNFSGKTSF